MTTIHKIKFSWKLIHLIHLAFFSFLLLLFLQLFFYSFFRFIKCSSRFCLIADMTNLYPFTQVCLEWPFSELFSTNVSLWNQYKYIAFNIFSWRILIISYKILIIIGISNEKNKGVNHIYDIMLKRHNILPTRTSFFISSAVKFESMQEFETKIFE